MTSEEKQLLEEIKRAASQKINVGGAIYGIIELRNGKYKRREPTPDPEPVDDGGEPFKSFSDELLANGWTVWHEPDGSIQQMKPR